MAMTSYKGELDSPQNFLMTVDSDTDGDLESLAASTHQRSVKWRMITLMLGLAMGTAIFIYSRQQTSLTTLRKVDANGITMLNGVTITEVELDVVIRDFKKSHPDMERPNIAFGTNLV